MKILAVPLVRKAVNPGLTGLLGTDYLPIDGRLGYERVYDEVNKHFLESLYYKNKGVVGVAVYKGDIRTNKLWFTITLGPTLTKENRKELMKY